MTQIPTWTGGSVSSTSGRAAPGTTIGQRYALRAAVGHGGMGTVWRAADTLLHRDVAVKEVVLPPGLAPSDRDAMYERTLREARAAAALQHPAVVQVYDVVTEAGRPWIVMELLDARSLADMVIEDGPVAPRAVAKIGVALLGALEVAHANGVLHRDVKPANVLICSDGRCVLTDFGVARMPTDVQLTTPGMVLGSPHFISPERALGTEFGPPSDLFSLGVTLYTAVEGRPPFDRGDPIETMHAVVEDPPAEPSRAGVLAEVLFGLLEKDPARRYDVQTARSRLRELLAGPLASQAPAHLATDPYAVVPAQRMPWQPPTPPQQPTGHVGGRAMIGPSESLADRLEAARPAPPAPAQRRAPGLDRTNPEMRATGELPPPRWEAPTGDVWAVSNDAAATGGQDAGHHVPARVRRSGASAVGMVRAWPRSRQLAAAGGLVVVVLLGAIALTARRDSAGRTVPQAAVTASAAAVAAIATETYAERGVSVNVPKGWKRSSAGVYIDFTDPATSGRRVRILVENSTAEPVRFLEAAESRLEKNASGSCPRPYTRLGLSEVELDGKPAGQLEYTCGAGPEMRHGIWRAVVEGGKAYSFYLSTTDARFTESRPIFDEMVRSFQLTAAG